MSSGVMITFIICLTLIILALIGKNESSNNKSDYYMDKTISYLAKIDNIIERNATGISIFSSDYHYKGIKQKVEKERNKLMEDN